MCENFQQSMNAPIILATGPMWAWAFQHKHSNHKIYGESFSKLFDLFLGSYKHTNPPYGSHNQ